MGLHIYYTLFWGLPGNADGNYEGEYSLKGGLTKSVNTISVKLIMDTGPENVAKLARALGISSDLPIDPSIALGTADLSLYEMLRVYATFANMGAYSPDVSNWNFVGATNMTLMFFGTVVADAAYDEVLKRVESTNSRSGITLDARNSFYTTDAATATQPEQMLGYTG